MPSDSSVVSRQDQDGIRILSLNRPEKRNALNAELVAALTLQLQQASTDGVRVVILTGMGKVFSAGADLAALERLQTASFRENLEESRLLAGLFQTIVDVPFPVVAAVNGHAIAGGTGLVAACDYAVAASGAKFGLTEVRLGFVPAIVLSFALRRLGTAAARDLMLTGRIIDATEAHRLHLVNRVVEAGEENASAPVLDAAVEWARLVADHTSASAVSTTRRLISELSSLDLETALERAAVENAEARGTPDCIAGVTAFLEKRDAPWKRGRDS